jgi:glutamine amidotransferase/cyclase
MSVQVRLKKLTFLQRLIVPGVGHFGQCCDQLASSGYLEPLQKYIKSGKYFVGICVGLQILFEGSDESPGVPGLGIIPGKLQRFSDEDKSVPLIGWDSAMPVTKTGRPEQETLYGLSPNSKYYYVHSFAAPYTKGTLEQHGWKVAVAKYGEEEFVGALARDNIFATQFHPEKSGLAGLRVIHAFLSGSVSHIEGSPVQPKVAPGLTRRIIACLDVRSNDQGDLIVTKGDQYDVREKEGRAVRNLGKPVEVAQRYYDQGADEICFLNITSFRNTPLADQPMLDVMKESAKTVFVPMIIGGGIRDTVDPDGKHYSALDVARLYFKAGADKVSIGGDAVDATEQYMASGGKLDGTTSIEQVALAYGNQAVVVSVDPKRVYVDNQEDTSHHTIRTQHPNDKGQHYVWWQCYVKGGREKRDVDVVQLVTAVEAMGCGEILLNSIDKDGTNSGFDHELINLVKETVKIPVIASSGAGNPGHFEDVFTQTRTDAALGAGMFHRHEYTVRQVKEHLKQAGLLVRPIEDAPDYVRVRDEL